MPTGSASGLPVLDSSYFGSRLLRAAGELTLAFRASVVVSLAEGGLARPNLAMRGTRPLPVWLATISLLPVVGLTPAEEVFIQ